MQTSKNIILIDDDRSNNYMCTQVLTKLCNPVPANIRSFTIVALGLSHVEEVLSQPDAQVVLFLDINMPSQLNGWEVLERLNELPESMQSRLTIFMLSSSTRPIEKAKAIGYRLVKNFIQKPMMTSMRWLKEEVMFEKDSKPFLNADWRLPIMQAETGAAHAQNIFSEN